MGRDHLRGHHEGRSDRLRLAGRAASQVSQTMVVVLGARQVRGHAALTCRRGRVLYWASGSPMLRESVPGSQGVLGVIASAVTRRVDVVCCGGGNPVGVIACRVLVVRPGA